MEVFPAARERLIAIWQYTAETWGDEQADQYVGDLVAHARALASRKPFGRPIDVDLRFWWENNLTVLGVIPSVISLAETSHSSSIGTKSSGTSWRGVWRKFAFKWALTWGNTRANRQRARLFE